MFNLRSYQTDLISRIAADFLRAFSVSVPSPHAGQEKLL